MVFGVCLCVGNKFITWKCHLLWETMRSVPLLQKQFSISNPIVQKFDDNIHWVNHYTMDISRGFGKLNCWVASMYQLDKQLLTSNNQRLEKCVQFVLLLYNWDLQGFFFGWPPTTDMVITSYFWISQWSNLNSTFQASVWFLHDIEAKRVSQSKMAARAWNDLAPAINTRGTEKRHK